MQILKRQNLEMIDYYLELSSLKQCNNYEKEHKIARYCKSTNLLVEESSAVFARALHHDVNTSRVKVQIWSDVEDAATKHRPCVVLRSMHSHFGHRNTTPRRRAVTAS